MDAPLHSVVLDGRSLDARALVAIARFNAPVQLGAAARAQLQATRQYIDHHWLTDDAPLMYAFNTGVGAFKNVRVGADQIAQFQTNLIRAASAGTGEPVPTEVVRAMMALRVNAFASDYSGVRPAIVDRLVAMLNHGITPRIAAQGSVGASGDLAPLAMMAGAMMGLSQSKVDFQGRAMAAADAFMAAGMAATMDVQAKDATALINGTAASLAYAVLTAHDARRLLSDATISLALSLEALRCETSCFDERVMLARPHPGQRAVAASMRRVLDGTQRCSEGARQVRLRSMAGLDDTLAGSPHVPPIPPRIQDAYSLRCAPQVHGPVCDALDYIDRILATEMNSATDNPLIFKDDPSYQVVSGGHFHGQYIAQAMDLLALVITDLSAICDRRSARLVDPACNFDLPAGLVAERAGVNTGLTGVQSMGTALVLENMGLCSPASATSLPAKGNTEDHISNSCVAARRSRTVVRNAQTVVAVEMLLATQALDLAERDLAAFHVGTGTQAAWDAVRVHLPASLGNDRWVFEDIEILRSLVEDGSILRAVEDAVGPLWPQTGLS
ncbi:MULTISPECIES: HAL/PAL/TAL family ammonia-lyase [Variovorax]|uniref:HAL/PAL/TAL family ammonia-lyase n=1 Tax=Variovorax TaxID=34072 RepID=UPI00039FB1B1|nr:aromatic amino acid ammonia-lyase [Variovorax paradoxus]